MGGLHLFDHIIGASSLAAGHLTLVPALRRAPKELNRENILIVGGGVIPPQDYPELRKDGAAAIFGPGTVITQAALGHQARSHGNGRLWNSIHCDSLNVS